MLIVQNTAVVRGVVEHILDHFEPGLFVACERRRISGCHLSPPKTNVCENDFRDVKILSQSQLGSQNPRTATRVACESIARSRGK